MSLPRSLLFALLCAGLANTPARAQRTGRDGAFPKSYFAISPVVSEPIREDSSELGLLVNEYLTSYWQFRPVSAATPAGVHSQDKVLEDWSASALQGEIT